MEPAGADRRARTYVAPRAWAFVVGVVVALGPFVAGLPGAAVTAGAVIGALLVVYFFLGQRRPSGLDRDDDGSGGPPGGWSTSGPFTSG